MRVERRRRSDPLRPHGLFEAHLEVRELDRSIAFYRDVDGLELAHVLPERQVAFFWIEGPGEYRAFSTAPYRPLSSGRHRQSLTQTGWLQREEA